MITMT